MKKFALFQYFCSSNGLGDRKTYYVPLDKLMPDEITMLREADGEAYEDLDPIQIETLERIQSENGVETLPDDGVMTLVCQLFIS